jgi:hypothetical protein
VRRPVGGLAFAALWLLGCNQIFGVGEPHLRARSDAGARDAAAGCLLPSDCQPDETCLFQHCSPPCAEDRDCSELSQCLRASDGHAACVRDQDNHCGDDAACPEGTVCGGDGTCQSACQDDSSCVHGRTCASGLCVLAPAADGGVDAGREPITSMSMADECSADAQRCGEGGMLERCGADHAFHALMKCPFLCRDGACIGACTPGAQRCVDEDRQTCSADGEFLKVETCPGTCTPSGCVAACGDGQLQCNERELQRCQGSRWLHDQDCPFVCSNGACSGECTPDAKRCNPDGKTAETCDATGHWASPTSCPFVCSDGACGGECSPDDKRCSDAGHAQTCGANGMYGAAIACGDQACVNGSCSGSCAPGAMRCNANAVERCDDTGQFAVMQKCTGQTCVNNACAGVCSPDDVRCAGSTSYVTCDTTGQFGTSPTSCNGAACSMGQCTGSCTPSTTRCKPASTSDVQTCNDVGVWTDSSKCTNQACVNGACSGECTPGSKRCMSGGTQTCGDDGRWSATSACTNQACVNGGCTGVCTPGATRCNAGGQVETCDDSGNFGGASACAMKTCVSGACAGECASGDKRCASGANRVEACNAGGMWASFQDCSSPSQICRNAACAANDAINVGYATTSGWTSASVADNRLLVVGPFDAGALADILSINVIGSAAGGQADMSIYKDNGGAPGPLLARSSSNIAVISGADSNSVKPAGVQLAKGAKFWLGAVFFNGATIPQSAGASFSTSVFSVAPFNFGTAPPDPFPAATATKSSNVALPFYVSVREVPP